MVRHRPIAPAQLPPAGIIGLDPDWSRLVHVPGIDGNGRTWHLLDTWATRTDGVVPQLTLLCVHGNPSWSFIWRDLLTQISHSEDDRVRAIAVDQLDMGYSERTGCKRNLATRIDDLCRLSTTLALTGPVITVAHDWGGPVSLGWASRHLDTAGHALDTPSTVPRASEAVSLAGVILTNTAVHQPPSAKAPVLIRLVRSRALLSLITIRTKAFIQGAIEMSRPRLSPQVVDALKAPYRDQSRRTAIADFVTDIPLEPAHESAAVLDRIAADLATMRHIPALLLWGPRDHVFNDLYLHDLERRLPHADVHRFPHAAHFVTEDAEVGNAVLSWLQQFTSREFAAAATEDTSPAVPVMTNRRALADFSHVEPTVQAVVEILPVQRSISFAELAARSEQLASGMAAFGIRPGQRVAVMVTPGIDLALAVYGCWRLGASLVLVDSGLGRIGMQRALQSASPDYLIGIDKALLAATALGWPGRRIAVASRSGFFNRALGIQTNLQALIKLGTGLTPPAFPDADAIAAVVFTSGSTGPSKGVIYRHHQIQAQRDALVSHYEIDTNDRLVAAFAPFALYGPTMGITSVVPAMDVTAPGTLTASALMDAVERVNATLVFASPAALRNVVATGPALSAADKPPGESVRLVLSAGAPVNASILKDTSQLFTKAELRTPYGMTEVLPVADISLTELEKIDEDRTKLPAVDDSDDYGVCVGYPLAGVTLGIDPIDEHGVPGGSMTTQAGILGEILVQAAHACDAYDRLWLTDYRASSPANWHRTGDVGRLDANGRLWIGGRISHVITTRTGPVAPVACEKRMEMLPEVTMATLVGVGPRGAQALVAVIQTTPGLHSCGGAPLELTDRIRHMMASDIDLSAVLIVNQLPVDRRHNSKIDRSAVADWAARVLSGDRVASL
ncbi:MAG: AMP-binding protein [Granulosicoccus sp.]|nr:AMP-binding protein [Granulosicoccus sp.]